MQEVTSLIKVWAAVTGLNQQKEEEQMVMLVCGGGVQGVGRERMRVVGRRETFAVWAASQTARGEVR